MTLVDTDVLIAHLRGVTAARDWLRSARRDGLLHVSAVTVAELTGGMRSAERHEVWRLLDVVRVVPVDEPIARLAGEHRRRFRRSHTGIGIADYLIAATAEAKAMELVTLNVRHFPMFPDLSAPFALPGAG